MPSQEGKPHVKVNTQNSLAVYVYKEILYAGADTRIINDNEGMRWLLKDTIIKDKIKE